MDYNKLMERFIDSQEKCINLIAERHDIIGDLKDQVERLEIKLKDKEKWVSDAYQVNHSFEEEIAKQVYTISCQSDDIKSKGKEINRLKKFKSLVGLWLEKKQPVAVLRKKIERELKC